MNSPQQVLEEYLEGINYVLRSCNLPDTDKLELKRQSLLFTSAIRHLNLLFDSVLIRKSTSYTKKEIREVDSQIEVLRRKKQKLTKKLHNV